MEPNTKRRRIEGNLRGTASVTGASGTNNSLGHLNVDLSALPEKTLLSVGADIGKSQSGQQPTQINNAIGQGFGRLELTNPMLLRDLWNGNVTLGLGELNAISETDKSVLETSRYYWLSKLRNLDEFRDRVDGHLMDNVPVATLKSLFESATGTSEKRGTELLQAERLGPKKRTQAQNEAPAAAAAAANNRTVEPGGRDITALDSEELPFSRIPFSSKVSTIDLNEMGDIGDEEDERKNVEYGQHSKYRRELLPFLPIVGASVLPDTRSEKHEKSLNEALFSNIIRDHATGDPNINPLAMGLRIQEGLRFNGNNKLLDPVHPGGSLNLGAISSTTERLMIPTPILEEERNRIVALRNMKMRFSACNDYNRGKQELAYQQMRGQKEDIQWENANKSVMDFQHAPYAFNTMPVDPEMWVYRRQIDGDVPFQDNLLPAQGLFVSEQMGCGYLKPSVPLTTATRQNLTFNPSMKFGWNYGTQFQ